MDFSFYFETQARDGADFLVNRFPLLQLLKYIFQQINRAQRMHLFSSDICCYSCGDFLDRVDERQSWFVQTILIERLACASNDDDRAFS